MVAPSAVLPPGGLLGSVVLDLIVAGESGDEERSDCYYVVPVCHHEVDHMLNAQETHISVSVVAEVARFQKGEGRGFTGLDPHGNSQIP